MLIRKTKRLVIRPLEKKDFDAWKAAHQGMLPAKGKWDHGPKPASELTRAKFAKMLKSLETLRKKDNFYDLGILNARGE